MSYVCLYFGLDKIDDMANLIQKERHFLMQVKLSFAEVSNKP